MTIENADPQEELDQSWAAAEAEFEESSTDEGSEADAEEPAQEEPDGDAEPAEAEEEEADSEEPAEDEEEPADAVEEKPEEAASEEDFQKLQELCKKFNYEFDGERVQNAHWVRLRQKEKQSNQRLHEKAQEKYDQLNSAMERIRAQYAPLEELKRAVDSGDYDAMAKAIGQESFQRMQMGYVSGTTAESAKVTQMQRELEAFKAQTAQQQARAQQAQAQQAQQAQYMAYANQVKQHLSQDPELKAMTQSDEMIHTVINVQRNAGLNPATGQPYPVEQAAKLLLEELRPQYATIGSYLGVQQPNAESGSGSPLNKAAEKKPKKTISQSKRSEASPPEDDDDGENWDESKWLAKWVD